MPGRATDAEKRRLEKYFKSLAQPKRHGDEIESVEDLETLPSNQREIESYIEQLRADTERWKSRNILPKAGPRGTGKEQARLNEYFKTIAGQQKEVESLEDLEDVSENPDLTLQQGSLGRKKEILSYIRQLLPAEEQAEVKSYEAQLNDPSAVAATPEKQREYTFNLRGGSGPFGRSPQQENAPLEVGFPNPKTAEEKRVNNFLQSIGVMKKPELFKNPSSATPAEQSRLNRYKASLSSIPLAESVAGEIAPPPTEDLIPFTMSDLQRKLASETMPFTWPRGGVMPKVKSILEPVQPEGSPDFGPSGDDIIEAIEGKLGKDLAPEAEAAMKRLLGL